MHVPYKCRGVSYNHKIIYKTLIESIEVFDCIDSYSERSSESILGANVQIKRSLEVPLSKAHYHKKTE